MRKIFMRICLGVDSPGGPCALEARSETQGTLTGETLAQDRGIVRSTERWAASVSLNEAVFELAPECTAQCEQGAIGCPRAMASGSGLGADSCSIPICPMSSCDIVGLAA